MILSSLKSTNMMTSVSIDQSCNSAHRYLMRMHKDDAMSHEDSNQEETESESEGEDGGHAEFVIIHLASRLIADNRPEAV